MLALEPPRLGLPKAQMDPVLVIRNTALNRPADLRPERGVSDP